MKPSPGDIFWAKVSHHGQVKVRPLACLKERGDRILGVAITTTPIDPSDWKYVRLPFDSQGMASTRLKKASWAVCDWLQVVHAEDLVEAKGHVPKSVLEEILFKVRHLKGEVI